MESPARTEAILRHLVTQYGANSVQFYDMNFFLREDHARELCERIAPLNLHWWCKAASTSSDTISPTKLSPPSAAGCTMIFFPIRLQLGPQRNAERHHHRGNSQPRKRIRHFDIIPEFSFVIGNPRDPERDTRETLGFIRTLKRINPKSEIIMYHYTPVPQRTEMYGKIDGQIAFPTTPDEWATKKWMDFTLRIDTQTPWLARKTKT